jgi:hypothetical protein
MENALWDLLALLGGASWVLNFCRKSEVCALAALQYGARTLIATPNLS